MAVWNDLEEAQRYVTACDEAVAAHDTAARRAQQDAAVVRRIMSKLVENDGLAARRIYLAHFMDDPDHR